MGLRDRFRRNKEAVVESVAKPVEEKPKSESSLLLEKLCKDDTALYTDLDQLAYLNLGLNKETCEEAMKKADASRATLDYRHAASLAFCRKSLDYFRMALNKYAEVAKPGDIKFGRAREVPERALEIAEDFYNELKKIKK